MAEDFDPVSWLRRLTESGSRVRLAPGVIGKSSAINIGSLVIWGIALSRISPDGPWWYNASLLVGAALVTAYTRRETKHMRDFAEKNPALALMEGADITEYKKFEAHSKGLPAGDKSLPVVVVGPASQQGTDVVKSESVQP